MHRSADWEMTYFDAGTILADRASCCGKSPSIMHVGIKWVSFMSKREDLFEAELHGMAHAAVCDTKCPIEW